MQSSETIHPEKRGFTAVHEAGLVGRVINVQEDNGAYLFRSKTACVGVKVLSPTVVRLRVFRSGQVDWTTTPGVIQRQDDVSPRWLVQGDSGWAIEAEGLRLSVSAEEFALTSSRVDDGAVFTLKTIQCHTDGRTTLLHASAPDHHFYGLGEKTSFLDKQGESYTMWNSDVYAPHNPEIEALYVSVPFAIHTTSTGSYGLFLDNPGKTVFDMRSHSDSYAVTTVTGDADIYVIHGDSIKDILRQYTELTGRLHLPPAWSLGYHQSRYSYMSSDEVLNVAATFREKEIPCDVIHLDIHYMNGYRVFTWDPARFADPKAMIGELGERGFHVVPIVDPGVKRDASYSLYQRGVQGDMFCKRIEGDIYFGDVWPGSSAFPDFTDDRVAHWWGTEHQGYVDAGIKGIWNDMNEPAVFNEIKTMEPDVMHRNNGNPKTHVELHNLYGLLMTKATYEGMRNLLDGERPFVLTRAGYAGVGRYGAVWTGDNRSFWEHMEMAVPMVLNMGLSGMPFAGPDIGGFAHHTNPELLVRWTQMGSLFPFCRNHSALDTVRQEPWAFGPQVESIIRKYLELRYQWIPYLYTLFYETSQTGLPVIRPLLLEYPEDEVVANLSDQFLLGTDIIVAPVFRPGVRQRLVYLPQGTWYDYWTGARHEGPQYVIASAPLDTMPLYVRAGAIVPSHPVQQYVEFSNVDTVTFTLYGLSEQKNALYFYEDDGHSLEHEAGVYNVIEVESVQTSQSAVVTCMMKHKQYDTHYKHRRFLFKHLENADQWRIENMQHVTMEALKDGSAGWTYCAEEDALIAQVEASADAFHIHLVLA